MKIARYKLLSQSVDTINLYKNSTLMSEIFMFGNSYWVFLKINSTNDLYMSKETLDGGFEQTRIPLGSQGITINRWELLKYYNFKKIDVNLLVFKINNAQFMTILENDQGQVAVYIDTTDNNKAMNFVNTACPLTVTKEDENQTIHSFNNNNDGTSSSILYNTAIDQSNYSEINPYILDDVITSTLLTPLSFNLLSSDTAGNDNLFIYAMTSNVPTIYSRNFDVFKQKIISQTKLDQTFTRELTQSSLLNYISDNISNNLSLVYFNNNTLIYFDLTNSTYIYKNIFANHTIDFDSSVAFNNSLLKFNLFKQILNTFNDITDFENMRISRVVINDNMFMQVESNLNLITNTIYKSHIDQFSASQDVNDIISPSTTNITSTLTGSNVAIT